MFALLAALAAFSAAAATPAPLPLGPTQLKETRHVHQVADGVTWTHIVRRGHGGPFRVDVLTVAPARTLAVLTARDRVPGLQTTSDMAKAHDAIAGVNGGYFAVDGDPTGVVVKDGQTLSEPVGPRTALLLPTRRIAAVHWHGKLVAGTKSRIIDGVDRIRGRIPACGGVGGDRPTQRVDPSTTCTDPSELVVLTPAYGTSTRTPAGGVEATVRDGKVSSVGHAADSKIPDDGYVLSGTGDAATFLSHHLHAGDQPQLKLHAPARDVVGGAPRLLRHGRIHITAAREGKAADTGRNPRTLAATEADGTVLLITIDGRRPGWSLGATLTESAKVARTLGATDALSLDSGGSTTMVVGTKVVNRPSQSERAVADGLFVLR